jgi:cytochrome c biogenesis protein CcmG/thiol:disulfide interchange protein DsbE
VTWRVRVRPAAAVAAVAALALVAGCTTDAASAPGASTSSRPAVGTPAAYVLPTCPRVKRVAPRADGLPALDLPCLGGGPRVRLSDLRGTPMVLNVWAAWCTICDEEMPQLATGMRRAGDRLRFFGVHYKAPEKYGVQSAADFGVPFPSVHDEVGDRIATALRVAAPPQTLFVTADGRIAGRKVGAITSQAQLDGLVRRYLGVRL